MPIFLFRILSRTRYFSTVFHPYGYNIFRYHYDKDKIGFWNSKSSLYWHLLNESKFDEKSLQNILNDEVVGEKLKKLHTIVDIGAGIGKQAHFLKNVGMIFEKYVPVDINSHVFNYSKMKESTQENFCGDINEFFDRTNFEIDLICSFDGVFEYFDRKTARRVFREAKKRGCEKFLITREGKSIGAGEHRDNLDGTIHYDFSLLSEEDYPSQHYVKKRLGSAYLIYPRAQ